MLFTYIPHSEGILGLTELLKNRQNWRKECFSKFGLKWMTQGKKDSDKPSLICDADEVLGL
jgi:hypothetical protein